MEDFYRANVYRKNGHALDIDVFVNPEKLTNYREIKWDGVNYISVVVDDDEYNNPRVFQASGWTADRGLFVDLY